MKILKKITAAIICVMITAAFSGCSDYVMTEDDLALQKAMQGYWLASESTGYNEYDENGNPTLLMVAEFTEDFKYFLHECYVTNGYVMTSFDPVIYTIEDCKFKTDVDGVSMYAGVSISDDGNTMYWITDESTDTYERITDEQAAGLGIPKYDKETWESSRAEYESSVAAESENGDTDSDAENTESSSDSIDSITDSTEE